MQRYFIDDTINDQQYTINSDDLHHLKDVMRANNNDEVILIDKNQTNYLCTIIDINNGILKVVKEVEADNELDVDITLAYALPKGDKFELVLQKATELGVKRIVPLITNRCVVKMNKERFSKKKDRYNKILKEASRQSQRSSIPILEDLIDIKEISKYKCNYNLVAYEETAKNREFGKLKETINSLQPHDTILVIVGSEGGFDKDEIEMLNSNDIDCCSLGKRILRSETAPLYICSVIVYSRED